MVIPVIPMIYRYLMKFAKEIRTYLLSFLKKSCTQLFQPFLINRKEIETEFNTVKLQFVSISSSSKTPLPLQSYDDFVYHCEEERADSPVVKTIPVQVVNMEKLRYRDNILQTIHRPYQSILYDDPKNMFSINCRKV